MNKKLFDGVNAVPSRFYPRIPFPSKLKSLEAAIINGFVLTKYSLILMGLI